LVGGQRGDLVHLLGAEFHLALGDFVETDLLLDYGDESVTDDDDDQEGQPPHGAAIDIAKAFAGSEEDVGDTADFRQRRFGRWNKSGGGHRSLSESSTLARI